MWKMLQQRKWSLKIITSYKLQVTSYKLQVTSYILNGLLTS